MIGYNAINGDKLKLQTISSQTLLFKLSCFFKMNSVLFSICLNFIDTIFFYNESLKKKPVVFKYAWVLIYLSKCGKNIYKNLKLIIWEQSQK